MRSFQLPILYILITSKQLDIFISMFTPCIIRRIRNDQQYALICNTIYFMYWLLHVSAVACHHQGAS
jgi:hypothetical protein